MPKLLFKVDGLVSGQVVFEAGKVYDISDEHGSATRWIKRGAEVVGESVAPTPVSPVVQVESVETSIDSDEVQVDDALAALGGEELEVVKEPQKKENKKEKKSSK